MSVTITSLDIEGFKRLKAVTLQPSKDGLTIIGGANKQGKTSVLDAIMYALGGEKYRPQIANHIDGTGPAEIRIELSNGLIVERKGKNGALKVTDPNGMSGGQGTLNRFIEHLALDMPRFMAMSNKEKADTLLQIIGAEAELNALDHQEAKAYEQRRDAKRDLDREQKVLSSMTSFTDNPPEGPVDVSGLMNQMAEAERTNRAVEDMQAQLRGYEADIQQYTEQLAELERKTAQTKGWLNEARESRQLTEKKLCNYSLVPVDPIKEKISKAGEINKLFDDYNRWLKQLEIVRELEKGWHTLDKQVEKIRANRANLLLSAKMPLEHLTVQNGELYYCNLPWDGMAESERMQVATAIVRELNPECGFVLIDKLEQLDTTTLQNFGAWCAFEGLQVIGTRVTTNADECSIIIEDGAVA